MLLRIATIICLLFAHTIMAAPSFTQSIMIKAAPLQVWTAIVDPALVAQYHLAPLKQIDLKPDGSIIYGTTEEDLIVGKITAIDHGQRLTHTFRFQPNHEGTKDDPETLVTYTLKETPEGTELTVTHTGFPNENQTFANIATGWPYLLESLKTVLEKN
jgi:uncharacterized protein YndB with AHSA1/START domain